MTYVTESRSISHGTMRNEDLIPAFVSELEDRQNDNLYTTDGDEVAMVAMNARITDLLAGIESRMEDDGYFDSEDADYDLESLFDALNEYAGEGFTFGAHPGDGSDYGYWPIPEEPGEYTDEVQDRLDAMEAADPNGYAQLMMLPFQPTNSEMIAHLDAWEMDHA